MLQLVTARSAAVKNIFIPFNGLIVVKLLTEVAFQVIGRHLAKLELGKQKINGICIGHTPKSGINISIISIPSCFQIINK